MGLWNAFSRWVLRTPLHGLLSKSFLLISFAGRKSGRPYTVPVNYVRHDGTLTITSYRQRTWWRNLRGGAPVTVWLRGSPLAATANVSEDDDAVAAGLLEVVRSDPRYARAFGVRLDPAGQPANPKRVAKLAQEHVVVRVHLS